LGDTYPCIFNFGVYYIDSFQLGTVRRVLPEPNYLRRLNAVMSKLVDKDLVINCRKQAFTNSLNITPIYLPTSKLLSQSSGYFKRAVAVE